MESPELDQDESILLESRNVKFKSISFDAILTTRRIHLTDSKKNVIPSQDITLATIRNVETGENAIRDHFLILSLVTDDGEKHQVVLTFARQAGVERKRECNEWAKKLKSLIPPSALVIAPSDVPVVDKESLTKREVPTPTQGTVTSTRPAKKKIEIARQKGTIIETGPGSSQPEETSPPPSGFFLYSMRKSSSSEINLLQLLRYTDYAAFRAKSGAKTTCIRGKGIRSPPATPTCWDERKEEGPTSSTSTSRYEGPGAGPTSSTPTSRYEGPGAGPTSSTPTSRYEGPGAGPTSSTPTSRYEGPGAGPTSSTSTSRYEGPGAGPTSSTPTSRYEGPGAGPTSSTPTSRYEGPGAGPTSSTPTSRYEGPGAGPTSSTPTSRYEGPGAGPTSSTPTSRYEGPGAGPTSSTPTSRYEGPGAGPTSSTPTSRYEGPGAGPTSSWLCRRTSG